MSGIIPIHNPAADASPSQGQGVKAENFNALIQEVTEEAPDQSANKQKKQKKPITAASFSERQSSPQDLVRGFAEKMANSNLSAQNNQNLAQIKQAIEQDMQQFYKSNNASKETVTISAQASKSQPTNKKADPARTAELSEEFVEDQLEVAKQKNNERVQNRQSSQQQLSPSQKKAQDQALNQYLQKYSESLITGKESSKQEKITAKEKLEELKLPTKHVQYAESKVRGLIRKDYKKRIKQSFIELALSFKDKSVTTDTLRVSQTYKRLLEGGYAQGAIHRKFNTLEDIKEEARSDIQNFLADELDFILTTKKINGASAKELIDAFNRYNDIATASKFNPGNYLRHFNRKCDDLGLNYFKAEEKNGVIDTDQATSNEQSSDNSPNKEQDQALLDELRSIYMERAIRKDLRSQIELGIKLRKTKKKVSKTIELTTEMLEKLEKEGIEEAKDRLWSIIRESFEERATLTSLKGAEGKIVQHKLSHAIKRLTALGGTPEKTKLETIQNQVNTTMFSIIKEEYLKVEALIESNPSENSLRSTKKKYVAILTRLKEESSIREEIKGSIINNLQLSEKTNIIEAA